MVNKTVNILHINEKANYVEEYFDLDGACTKIKKTRLHD